MRFIDLFGGIGGFRLGLEKASEQFECVDYIEYDKYAVKSYNAIFKEEHEPRDVTKLSKSEIPDHDLLCAGFPCQSFSVAGNRQGTDEARGKLFREIARIAEAKRPEMLLLENVKGILSQKAVKDGESVEGTKGHAFTEVLQALHELGYCLEWQVLNSKNWGVPQNRERVFIVGHLGGEPQSKVFPIGREDRGDSGEDGREGNQVTHNAVIEALARAGSSSEYLSSLKAVQEAQGLNTTEEGDAYTGDASYFKGTSPGDIGSGRRTQIVHNQEIVNPLEGETDRSWFWEQMVYSRETDVVRALKKNSSKNKPMILNHQFRPESRPSIENGQSGGSGLLYNTDYSYALSSSPHYLVDDTYGFDDFRKYVDFSPSLRSERTGLNVNQPCLTPGRVEKRQNGRRMKEDDDPMFTLTGQDIHGVVYDDYNSQIRHNPKISGTVTQNFGSDAIRNGNELKQGTRIRKLTPRECWRLQGFPDWAFDRAVEENSDTQLYKQAGNAVTVNVIEALGEEIIEVRTKHE